MAPGRAQGPPAASPLRRLPPWALAAALLLPAALLALGAGAADATHAGAGVSCRNGFDCHLNLIPKEAQSVDVWVDQENPDRNYDDGGDSEFLLVRAPQPRQAWTLLRFPIEEVPRNASITDVQVVLTYADAPTGGRTIKTYEVRTPFQEAAVNWTTAQAPHMLLEASAVNNVSVDVVDPQVGVPGQGGGPTGFGQLVLRNDCGSGGCPEPPHRSGITDSFRKYHRGDVPYHGHLLRDQDDVVGPIAATQKFYGSKDAEERNRPRLIVSYDPNGPELRHLTVDGQPFRNASSNRTVNLSFEVSDRVGSIVNAWVNATTLEGHEVFNRSIFVNRSTHFANYLRHRVWSEAPLDLPAGQYIVNALAIDNDGNINYTEYRLQANLTVENEPPFVNQTRLADGTLVPFVSAAELGEGELLRVALNASDGHSGIHAVRLEVRRGPDVVANVSLEPRRVDANNTGDWNLTLAAAWAGQLNLTLWVEDGAGNLNRSAVFPLRVRDTQPPRILEARVLAPGRSTEGATQELGGRVAWQAVVIDASPLVTELVLSPPGGVEQRVALVAHEMCRNGLDDDRDGRVDEADCTLVEVAIPRGAIATLYRHEANLTEQGAWGATVQARDPDGNTDARGGLGLFVLPATPPAIDDPRPAPDRWAPGRPVVSAVVTDLNLDPQSLTLEVRVPPSPFTPAEARSVGLTASQRRIEVQEQFFHGERVEVRVRARDLLGLQAERTWSFTVDALPPVTFLSPDGAFEVLGNRTALRGGTPLRVERSDEGSGMLATVLQVVNEDQRLTSGNITLTGADAATLSLRGSPVYQGTGNYTVFYGSVDVAGNVEEVQRRAFLVDDAAPLVEASFEPGLVTARVREAGSGVRDVKVHYWLSPGGEQGSSLMGPAGEPGVWQAVVPDGERGSRVLYAVEATDLLGNVGRAGSAANPLSALVGNHKPVVTIDPPNGSLVRGTVTIAWSVHDRDGDNVLTSVAVRPSTATDARELAPQRGPTGELTWDTGGIGDGLWEVIVVARDGFDTVRASSFVEVGNTDSKIAGLKVSAQEPGKPVRIEATLFRPVERAEAVVRLGGQEVARVALRDDGAPPDRRERDGVFTGAFVPGRAGDYRVDLDVRFEDGRLETKDEAAMVEVQWPFPARIVHEPLLLLLLVGGPLALAGFALHRRYGPPRFLRKWRKK